MKLEQIATILRTTPQTLRQTLAPYDNDVAQWRPAPDEWCINEVLGHLIEADQHAFAARIKLILDEDNPTIARWSAGKAAKERHDCQKNVHDLLTKLAAQRAELAQFVEGLDLSQLERRGTYPPMGQFHASDFLYEWPYHDFDHIQQIMDILKAHIWPLMSDTMRSALGE
ncbi:MAG: DinB family protein [Ardenticatenaceae bacterium]